MSSLIVPSDNLPQGPISNDASHKRFFSIAPRAVLIFFVLIFVAGAIVTLDHKEVRSGSYGCFQKVYTLNSESSFLLNVFLQNLSILQLQPKEVFAAEEIRTPAASELHSEPTEEPNICEVKSISFCSYYSWQFDN